MRGTRGSRRWVGLTVGVFAAMLLAGCVHTDGGFVGPVPHDQAPIQPPPEGAVPVELKKITFPPYVIEAPDQLLIEVITRGPVVQVGPDGKDLLDDKKQPIKKVENQPLPVQKITGSFLVRMDGTVGLGIWGSVIVSGLTMEQAAVAIRQHLINSKILKQFDVQPEALFVYVDVLAYNSKRYYVITDGGGYGEQVYPFPILGSETILDAMGNVYGLPAVASKRNIWVARRTPHAGQNWQILPVDWIGITQYGHTMTNYQIMPGDRIYVKAQRIITIDTTLARIISPFERILGVTLLGSNTVNSISGNNGTTTNR